MNEKIEDNPSFQELSKQLKGADAIKQIASLLSPSSGSAKNISKSFQGLDDIEKQFKVISKSPDEFNNYFGDLGWIAHESMNHPLMMECIELAKSNNIKTAEEKLADYYTSENLKWLLGQLRSLPEFYVRYKLIRLAYEDTITQRYHSVVPNLLMVIDGGVNDIDRSKGFFTDTVNLTAWDSIAAHSTGLSKLRNILNKGRTRTNSEEIFLPYRNGILHGRDLSFANKYIAGKCWLTLIAISDWAKAVKKNKKNPPKNDKEMSFTESVNELKNTLSEYAKHQEKLKETNILIEDWKPRALVIDQDILATGGLNEYPEFTPERDAMRFLHNWKNKNFGEIAKQVNYFSAEIDIGKEAGKVRKIFEKKFLKEYKILSVIDCAPAVSEIMVNIVFEFEQRNLETEIKLRMIYQNEKGENMILGQKNGVWKFISSFFFHKIEFPE